MTASQTQAHEAPDMKLFWCCFIALVTTSFGFIIRAFSIGDWGREFGLTATQQGEILGVGVWPFAISIVLFSLIIDKIGYKVSMLFAFVCHFSSVLLTIAATDYWGLYWATFVAAIAAGTVEAAINPVVATMFKEEKTKWLNILHAGWPGGLALAGLIMIALADATWQTRMLLMLIPTTIYGVWTLALKFPINERVAAGVPYKDMLAEMGAVGVFIVSYLIYMEVGRVFELNLVFVWALIIVTTGAFWAYVRSFGRILFTILLLIMIPLAITELGTDGWITELMGPVMKLIGLHAGWVIVYTSIIMVILRFYAGPVVKLFTPLGLLAICAGLAAVGLFWLSAAQAGVAILIAATMYGIAKSYFWPTMLGVVAERFPKGVALTLNAIAGLGMLSAGVIGAVFLGLSQDRAADNEILQYDLEHNTALHSTYVTDARFSVLGPYMAVDRDALAAAPAEDVRVIEQIQEDAKKTALATVAILPFLMMVSYILLILYFRSKGGYTVVKLDPGFGGSREAGH
jgi:MFS family permease